MLVALPAGEAIREPLRAYAFSKGNICIKGLLGAAPHLIPVGFSRVPIDTRLGFIHEISKGVHLQGAVQICGRATREGDIAVPHDQHFL